MIRHFAIGDIHGDEDKRAALFKNLEDNAKLDLTQDVLVQLGDKPDRGKHSYEVMEFFAKLSQRHPDNVICLMGNHEEMMLNAVRYKDYSLYTHPNNGGKKTMDSYGKAMKRYGKGMFPHAVSLSGHLEFLMRHRTYYETDDYFFCHAPINKYRHGHGKNPDIRVDSYGLLWNWFGNNTEHWVESDFEGKIAVHGHITGIYERTVSMPGGHQVKEIIHPGVRNYGNTFLIDTGCGVWEEGYLTAIELPTKTIYTSRGEVIPWKNS